MTRFQPDSAQAIRWARVNDEPFEYAIQQGPHGDEFVKLLNGACLRRPLAALPSEAIGREWQDISTAPLEIEFIGQDSDGRVFNCRCEADDCGENWYDVHGDQLSYPIRWMPLPPSSVTRPTSLSTDPRVDRETSGVQA